VQFVTHIMSCYFILLYCNFHLLTFKLYFHLIVCFVCFVLLYQSSLWLLHFNKLLLLPVSNFKHEIACITMRAELLRIHRNTPFQARNSFPLPSAHNPPMGGASSAHTPPLASSKPFGSAPPSRIIPARFKPTSVHKMNQ